MDKIIESIGSNVLFIIAIVCYTIYQICALKKSPTKSEKYEELKTLNELREKGIITQEEFDEKKTDLLNE
jgi:hypothetical protein